MAEYLSSPDAHLDPTVAAAYAQASGGRFEPEAVRPAVEFLTDLAGSGRAVEFAVGTGRLALPLAETGVEVLGIDVSAPMLAELAARPGADRVAVTLGDMTTTTVCTDASLVFLVYNTITNLRTQELQIACFVNAAAHLAPGGSFVIENLVPGLRGLQGDERIRPFDVSPDHLGFEEYVDLVNQISISHHYHVERHVDGDRVRVSSPAFRYVWPSELDLMARLAGLELVDRFADWDRQPFVDESPAHVSVWRKPA